MIQEFWFKTMIIKLKEQAVIDGKLREKGEIIRATTSGGHIVIKNDKELRKIKKVKIKKNGKQIK